MFFETTVNSILSKFVKTIEELDKHAEKMDNKEHDKQEAAALLMVEADQAKAEKVRAQQIASKMREVFSV